MLQTTQDKDQILAENHRTITELIALAAKLEQEKKIVILERNKAISSRNAKDTENGILQGKINFLLDESKDLKRELSNQKKNHEAEIELKENKINDLCKYQLKLQEEIFKKNKELFDFEDKIGEVKREVERQKETIEDLKKTQARLIADYSSRITNLNQEIDNLKEAKETAERDRDKAIQKGRLMALGNVVQGAIDYVPGIPKA